MPNGPTATLQDLRHVVYAEVISSLAPASVEQTEAFMANLKLPRESLMKFTLLRVSPGLGRTPMRGDDPREILARLDRWFGRDAERVPGFYRNGRGNLSWTLPPRCALYGYRSHLGMFNGVLCQPLDSIDKFWLLSSAKYAGPKAIRMVNLDLALFEAGVFKSVSYLAAPPPPAGCHVGGAAAR